MRPKYALLAAALCLFPMAAQARPVVWLHVLDGATQRVESADLAFHDGRAEVEAADHAIVDAQGERQEFKSRRRDARAERIIAHRDVHTAHRELHKARRSGDEAEIARRTHRYEESLATYDQSRGHVRWHNSLMGVSRADMRLQRARYSGKAAELELDQSILLAEHGYHYMYGPKSFQRQVERIDRRIEKREGRLEVAQNNATDIELDYLASKN